MRASPPSPLSIKDGEGEEVLAHELLGMLTGMKRSGHTPLNSYVYSIANKPDLYKLTCLLVGLIESRAMVAVGDGFEGDHKGPSFGLTPALSTAWEREQRMRPQPLL